MACPTSGIVSGCSFVQLLVDETPRFDELIMQDIRPTDGWIGNFATGTTPIGTPTEITQDRFRAVWPNTTRPWARTVANGPGCTGNPCDPVATEIGYGADRLTYYAEEISYRTKLFCYFQAMHITHAKQHLDQVIGKILKPATSAVASMFARKRTLQWAKYRHVADSTLSSFTSQWNNDANGNEVFLDMNVAPANVYLLMPQMLQNNFSLSMLEGYAGENPFKETAPFIELVTDMDTLWLLERLGGQHGTGSGSNPSPASNWRFTEWDAANKYWRYGFSGQIGNYMARTDHMNMRFNYVTDLGAGANGGNGNRYRYQLLIPYENSPTTGAGGGAGIGSDPNQDFQQACFTMSFQSHKKGLEFLVPDSGQLNPEMPFGHVSFGGQWQFQTHDLGEDQNGVAIDNSWHNKGRFAAMFKYYVRPLHTEFLRAYFHRREQMCIPQLTTCQPCGYPSQNYSSSNTNCPNV